MITKKGFAAVISAILLLALAGCNFPVSGGSNTGPGAFYTQAAQTIVAQMTYSVIETFVADQTQQAIATSTPEASATPTIEPSPTASPTSTNTPRPPTSTPIPTPCNAIQFIADVTIEDGEVVKANESFYKIWRLKNVGTCSWTTDYDLVFVDGDQMDGDKAVPLTYDVDPGETIDVAVYLTAPAKKGTYKGYWMLRTGNGSRFGFGPYADQVFWVSIVVKSTAPSYYNTPFSFVNNYCLAEWMNGDQGLPCPGSSSSEAGYAIYLKYPITEKGKDDEPGIWVHPEFVKDGEITAKFPPILIQDGDTLVTAIGCMQDATKCNVDFEINYRADGGSLTNLGSWNEIFDHSVTKVNEDLSFLKDQKVVFYFTVTTNGGYTNDDAFWLAPAIR